MSSSEQQRLQEEELQQEIAELRSDLGETVEALVHKADLPARAKERGNELKEQAVERGSELKDEWRDRVLAGWSAWRARALDAAQRAQETVNQMPKDRWAQLAGAGIALIALLVIVRRVRIS
jgi:ElaB/YqjD/DUF883 family membrane-anchored ribosome-binding protein